MGWIRRALALAAGAALVALSATAQGPDLNQLALGWAARSYATPLVCRIGDEPQRGLRRLVIGPGPRGSHRTVGRIEFSDLAADDASRCFDELGRPQPNLLGWVDIHLPGHSRPDTAERDFKNELRRKRGFTFEIAQGRLQLEPIGADAGSAKTVNFGGGEAKLELLQPGMDEARLLADFVSPRKLVLRLSAPDGTEFVFPLFYAAAEGADRAPR